MTAESSIDVPEERDPLKREVAMLSEQLRQMARIEHALTRARRGAERKHDLITGLARFAFDIAGIDQASDVLNHARTLLLDLFQLEDGVVLHPDPTSHALRANGLRPVSEAAWLALHEVHDACVIGRAGPLAEALTEALAAADCRTAGDPVPLHFTVIPIKAGRAEGPALLVGWRSGPAPSDGVAEDLPFLQLFANHIGRALDATALVSELRQQQSALTAANQQLKHSMRELERTQGQLLQAQKLEALGRLAGGIAHDFNNLLTVIIGHVDMVRPAVGAGTEAEEDLKVISDAATRASDITKRLLAFGRKQEGANRVVELNAAAIDLSRMLGRLIGDDIVLQLDLDPGIGRVRVDPVHLEQILMNLVVNARDAMPAGGRLTIETRRARHTDQTLPGTDPANLVALTVRDTGVGMTEDIRRQLFEPFFTTKPVGKGTGLGLATVYGLVNQNHGQVIVSSTPGQGSLFVVLLQSAEAPRGERALKPMAANRGRVLVVEDEDAIRRVVCRVLRHSGFEVCEARDGAEALTVAGKVSRLELVVTDVMMPTVGGPQLIESLRSHQPALKAVFMSGNTFDRLSPTSLHPEVDRFLPKPFTPDQLRRLVDQLIVPMDGGFVQPASLSPSK